MQVHNSNVPPPSGNQDARQPSAALAQLQLAAATKMNAFYSAFHMEAPKVVNPTGATQVGALVK